ncbi:hypothetical protein OG689_22815 [Kitasatospora sp. NBC_00240]|uniref:hypothetical protein n=1 Tax=Kitasatospora sp. NBC_00240 TaxID=2903567 RepID=UPI002254FBE5|nr:hypothetical protein [Kitasatospora sp. NBC_00240]MCX5212076.1 hypothetical protein [Kitasatospora sp. NBC_00240]
MTIPQSEDQQAWAPAVVGDRSLPACCCPANCGGRPEAGLRLVSPYPAGPAGGGRVDPPAYPHRPSRPGELVLDTLNRRTGVFMDRVGTVVFLRPAGGGVEWDVDGRWLDRVPRFATPAGSDVRAAGDDGR